MAPCACQSKSSITPARFAVKRPNNTTYKTFSTRVEAEAAALRIEGSKVVQL
jgi:hypothetical protein